MIFLQTRYIGATAITLLILGVLGCGPMPVTQTRQVVLPESFDEEGNTWIRQEWSDHHEQHLAAFFNKQVHLAENPEFRGEKVCYENASGQHRCYFITAVGDTSRWIMVEFRGRNFKPVVEGGGAPFDQLEPKE